MAESKWLDLAQTVMIERYDLDEMTYSLESFSEGAKAVSLKMSDGFIPVSVKFPIVFLEMERIRRMTDKEKRATFAFYAPVWGKQPPEFRELFSDIVDDWENIDEVPKLIESDDEDEEEVLPQEGEPQVLDLNDVAEEDEDVEGPTLTITNGVESKTVPLKPKRKVSARKPVGKKK